MAGGVVAGIQIFWIAPIFVGQQIGSRKGRAGWAWGLLLGWIGVIIVAAMSPTDTHECPWCREPVRLGAAVCPHCHRDVSVSASPGRPASATATGIEARRVAADERPAVAQERLDEATSAVAQGKYPKAFSPMNDESYEADRRGDPQALELLLNLANKIHQAPEAHARIRNDARELAQRLERTLLKYAAPVPGEPPLPERNIEITPPSSTERSNPILEIVRERYARGEISREEFQQLTSDLGVTT
jgi:hypothetical protein